VYLVYFEEFNHIEEAIQREKQLKNWHTDWKLNLIKSTNPRLKDLSQSFLMLKQVQHDIKRKIA